MEYCTSTFEVVENENGNTEPSLFKNFAQLKKNNKHNSNELFFYANDPINKINVYEYAVFF